MYKFAVKKMARRFNKHVAKCSVCGKYRRRMYEVVSRSNDIDHHWVSVCSELCGSSFILSKV